MALSIHYRIEQQFYFWDLLNINEEEKKEIIYHRNNTVITKDDKDTIFAIKLLKIGNRGPSIDTFIRHNNVIFSLYKQYQKIINIDKTQSNIPILLDILNPLL